MEHELPPEISEEIAAFEEKIEGHKGEVKVFLLGPGYPREELELRKKVASALNREGYSVIVMEAIPEWKEVTVGEKFKALLDEHQPDLFVCIFSRRGYPHGVIFEIGFLCGHYGRDKIIDKLRFCVETGVNKRELLTIYVLEILSEARTYDYDKHELKDVIEGIIKREILEKF
jgi:hypothetical protein